MFCVLCIIPFAPLREIKTTFEKKYYLCIEIYFKAVMEYKTALQKASAYCAQCERAISEVKEKLQKWDVQNADIEKITENLITEDFLNEQRYCNAFVKDKFRFNRWGKTKIAYMLLQKKVSEECVYQALDTIDEEGYLSVLADLLKSKAKTVKVPDKFQKEQKLFRFAASRGFETEAIKKVLIELRIMI